MRKKVIFGAVCQEQVLPMSSCAQRTIEVLMWRSTEMLRFN